MYYVYGVFAAVVSKNTRNVLICTYHVLLYTYDIHIYRRMSVEELRRKVEPIFNFFYPPHTAVIAKKSPFEAKLRNQVYIYRNKLLI